MHTACAQRLRRALACAERLTTPPALIYPEPIEPIAPIAHTAWPYHMVCILHLQSTSRSFNGLGRDYPVASRREYNVDLSTRVAKYGSVFGWCVFVFFQVCCFFCQSIINHTLGIICIIDIICISFLILTICINCHQHSKKQLQFTKRKH